MKFSEFSTLADRQNVTAVVVGPNHWRLSYGRTSVDFWPAKKGHKYFLLNGGWAKSVRGSAQQAIACCKLPAVPHAEKQAVPHAEKQEKQEKQEQNESAVRLLDEMTDAAWRVLKLDTRPFHQLTGEQAAAVMRLKGILERADALN